MMTIKVLPTAFLYLLYSAISTYAFMLTAGGWLIIIEIYASPVLPLFGFFLLISRFFRTITVIPKIVFRRTLILIFVFQIFALLFNYGDCGDAAGTYNFIQSLFAGGLLEVCNPQVVSPIIPVGVVLSIRLIYYALNLFLILVLTGLFIF